MRVKCPLSWEAVNRHAYLLPKTAVNTPAPMLQYAADVGGLQSGVLDPFTILCLIGAGCQTSLCY
jgi:hypothetical protein